MAYKCLFVKKTLIEDQTLSDEAFAVWCAVRSIFDISQTEEFISYNRIAHILYNRTPTRYELAAIKKGFNELVEIEEIVILLKYSNSEFKVDLLNMTLLDNEYYSGINVMEMRNIFAIDTTANKFKLLRYFTCMVGTFNHSKAFDAKYRGRIGGMSMECFFNLLGISETTISKYNKILMDNELLYVIHNDFVQSVNDHGQSELRELPNTYSRYRDRELAAEFAGMRSKERKVIDANKRRSLAQMYNNLCRGKEYDINTILQIYEYVTEWNDNSIKAYHEAIDSGREAELKQKDLSVFDKYIDKIRELGE